MSNQFKLLQKIAKISKNRLGMDTDKRVPIPFVFLLLCNTCDVSSFATQNSKKTV